MDCKAVIDTNVIVSYLLSRRKKVTAVIEIMMNELLDFFRQNSIVTETWETGVELPDPDDLPFFEAYIAEQGPETFLVTGNQEHYPEWPYIVTPRQMMDYLGE